MEQKCVNSEQEFVCISVSICVYWYDFAVSVLRCGLLNISLRSYYNRHQMMTS